MDEQELDVIESAGGFALAESGGGYVVVDVGKPGEPLGRFAGDDDGFARAERLYKSVIAPYRRHRYGVALLALFVTALVVHVLSLTIYTLLESTGSLDFSFGETSSLTVTVAKAATAAAAISNAAWIAALATMAGVWLFQRVFPKP